MGGAPPTPGGAEPTGRVVFVFTLMTVGLYLAAGPLVRMSRWTISPELNHGLLEATAWLSGRLDLPPMSDEDPLRRRWRDTAYHDGKVYNVFPPLFTFFCCAALGLQRLQGMAGPEGSALYLPWFVGLVVLPLPIVGFWAFRRACGDSVWAAVMTACWLLGTPMLKMLANCHDAPINEIHHILCNTGLMLIAGDLLGRRRFWPSAIGLLVCAWTRQLTILYFPAIAWLAWRTGTQRRSALAWTCAAAAVALGVLGSLNWAKFGSPLESGYAAIYTGRPDLYAERARQYDAVFDARFIPRNLYWMNLALPEVTTAGMGLRVSGEGDGASIWITSPLLLMAFWEVRRWWADPARRALMLASLLVIAAFLCYHTTGSVQRGFHRFSLDFIPIWLAVIAPYLSSGPKRWITLACLAWSGLYFHLLCSPP